MPDFLSSLNLFGTRQRDAQVGGLLAALPLLPPRPKVSAVVICKNEELTIGECLESLRWCDEIVLVDSGSTDRTLEIARRSTQRIYHRDWTGFADQYSYALEMARYDWIFLADADEVTTPELQRSAQSFLAYDSERYDGARINRRPIYLGEAIQYSGWYPDLLMRLFRRGTGTFGGEEPHISVKFSGRAVTLRGDLLHYAFQDLEDHLNTINRYSSIQARKLMQKGRRLIFLNLVFRPLMKFLRHYVYLLGFLDGIPGLILAVNAAYYVFLRYAKLYEMFRPNPLRLKMGATPCTPSSASSGKERSS